MFDLERFVGECRAAVKDPQAKAMIAELVSRAVDSPATLLSALGEPTRAGVNKIYVADDLTILNLVWGPEMYLYPHDHQMWAVIGLYCGREDNTFFRREDNGLKQHGLRTMEAKEVAQLGVEAIHSVKNPLTKLTGALHIYGGNFFETPRSEWDPQTFEEQPYCVARALQTFEDSNRVLDAMKAGAVSK